MVRFKNRYLVCAVEFERDEQEQQQRLNAREIYGAMRNSVEHNFGNIGAGHALAVLSVKYWSPHLGLAIVRASREHFNTVWAAITFITEFGSSSARTKARMSVVHVGATIRACQKASADYAERLIREVASSSQPERSSSEGSNRLRSAATTLQQDLAEMDRV